VPNSVQTEVMEPFYRVPSRGMMDLR
jgi:hypothetical protein